MIYAVRNSKHNSTLVEFISPKEMKQAQQEWPTVNYWRVSPEYARKWVKQGAIHETALWVDDGKVRRA